LALAESEQSLILGQFRAAGVGSVGKMSMNHFFFFFFCMSVSIRVSWNSESSHDPSLKNAARSYLVFN